MDNTADEMDMAIRELTEAISASPGGIQDGCGNCHACLVNVMQNGLPVAHQRMILCPECGNKRCPKASNHRCKCTKSNEPGQPGSVFANAPEFNSGGEPVKNAAYWKRLFNKAQSELAANKKAFTPPSVDTMALLISESATKAKIAHWLANGKVGESSKTMALYLGFGVLYQRASHPYDPPDFDRCLLLLDQVPELKKSLWKMGAVSDSWSALIDRWDILEQSHLGEAGLGWSKAQSAPITYKLIRSVLDGV